MSNSYEARLGLSVCLLTRKAAEAHVRRTMNIPAGVGLGWRPHTIIITDRALPYRAFGNVSDLRRWLRRTGCSLRLSGRRDGVAFGSVVARS